TDNGPAPAPPPQCCAAAQSCPPSRACRTASARPSASSTCRRHSRLQSPVSRRAPRVPSRRQQTPAPHPASPTSRHHLASLLPSALATSTTPSRKSPSPCSTAHQSTPARPPAFRGISALHRPRPAGTSFSHSPQLGLLPLTRLPASLQTTAPPKSRLPAS